MNDNQEHTSNIKSSLDELFCLAKQYRSSKAFNEFIQFVGRFHFYSTFNAMLIHVQKPGARFVASASRWVRDYDRHIKPNAQPLVIMQPQGPVMFVFDVSDTEPGPKPRPLPPEVDHPFDVRKGHIGQEIDLLMENAKRDGVAMYPRNEGTQSAGSIKENTNPDAKPLKFFIKRDKVNGEQYVSIPLRYELIYNQNQQPETVYSTIVHELAHLYCGHLGTPDEKWWKGRRPPSLAIREFEAESVAYLICARIGIDNPSEKYLAGYVKDHDQVPDISLESIIKATGLIEQMSKGRMKPRKDSAVKDGNNV